MRPQRHAVPSLLRAHVLIAHHHLEGARASAETSTGDRRHKSVSWHEMDTDTFSRHLDINQGVIFATRAVAPILIAQRFGHIVNVASIAAISHVPGLSAYCASKHAVRGFSLAIAHELARHGVAVTVVYPDAVETPMLTLQEVIA